jgi:ubiquinone/menaquinone biosynthesis C-methylase UbiE
MERIPGPLAPVYEKAARLAIETYYRPLAGEITAQFGAGLFLDIGAGPGYLPIEISRRSPAARVICLDLSRQLIRRARRNAQSAGVAERMAFTVGHAAMIPFGADRFDMVISTGVLHSLEDPRAFFVEVRRVLKKGAQAWVFDPARVTGHIDADRWKKSLTPRERFLLWLFKRIGIHKEARALKKQQVEDMLVRTDFDHIDIETTRHDIRIRLVK